MVNGTPAISSRSRVVKKVHEPGRAGSRRSAAPVDEQDVEARPTRLGADRDAGGPGADDQQVGRFAAWAPSRGALLRR
jgi:hypothetical protein